MDSEILKLAKTDRNPIQETEFQKLLTASGIPFTVVNGKANIEGFGSGGNEAGAAADSFFSPANLLIQSSIAAYTKQLEAYNKRYGEFTEQNPFVFDQVLEEESAKARQRLDPYYQQTLGDYLQGVNTKRTRSLQDERTLLTELQRTSDTYVGNEKAQLEDAVDKSQQGFADAGIYDSGARLREEGRLRADSNQSTDNFLHNQDVRRKNVEQSTSRGLEDLTFDENLKRRELKTEQEYQVNTQALPATQQRQKEYEFKRQQYAGVAPGVDPMQFQNSLYSLLG